MVVGIVGIKMQNHRIDETEHFRRRHKWVVAVRETSYAYIKHQANEGHNKNTVSGVCIAAVVPRGMMGCEGEIWSGSVADKYVERGWREKKDRAWESAAPVRKVRKGRCKVLGPGGV